MKDKVLLGLACKSIKECCLFCWFVKIEPFQFLVGEGEGGLKAYRCLAKVICICLVWRFKAPNVSFNHQTQFEPNFRCLDNF
jgi:hypothetical protein